MVAFQNPIIQYLVIPSGATTGQRIVIDGVNGRIIIYDANNNIVGEWDSTGVLTVQNDTNTGRIRLVPQGEPGQGFFPSIEFSASNTPGGYANNAWIQANPDSLNNPQIGINNGPYTDTSGLHNARGRLFLEDHVAVLQQIDTGTQASLGGSFESYDTGAVIRYTDPTNTANSVTFSMNGLGSAVMPIPLQLDTAWYIYPSGSIGAGWSIAGTPNAPFGFRKTSRGYVEMRGALVSGTITDGTQIFQVPGGYINTTYQQFIGQLLYTGFPSNAHVVIDTSGNCTVYGLAGTTGVLGFDGVSFPMKEIS